MADIAAARVRRLLRMATPGPWRVSEHSNLEVWADRDPAGWDAFMVATTSTRLNPDGGPHAVADAELTASAPDIARAYLQMEERLAAVLGLAQTWEGYGRDGVGWIYFEDAASEIHAAAGRAPSDA